MEVREINEFSFSEFANRHTLKNFYQTKEYGRLMKNSEFSIIYVGAFQNDILIAASLILWKTIGPNMKYGYAPRGFLVDYYDNEMLTLFTKKIKEFFFKKGFAFIKINPEITYSVIDFDKRTKTINTKNKELITKLKELGYDKLKDNLYFESVLPKYTPVIYLQKYDFNNLDNSIIKSVEEAALSGLKITSGSEEDIEKFYSFIDEKDDKTVTYYKYFYNAFKESNMVDLLLVELDYNNYVKYLQKQYIYEQEKNDKINKEFNENPKSEDIYNAKMKSDQLMDKISADIKLANDKMQENNQSEILGGAFIIKHEGRITLYIAGIKNDFLGQDAKTFLYYKIIEEYKKAGYLYLDLYGITADFSDTNPYKKLNDFKLKFKPIVFEYIGEFDLIVNKPFHQLLWSTNKIQREFYKPPIQK